MPCSSAARPPQYFPYFGHILLCAGTDILEGDNLGRMAVDEAAVLARDEMVWRFALEKVQAPIVMVLSGGEGASSDRVAD